KIKKTTHNYLEMKKKSASQSAFFNLRVLIRLFVFVACGSLVMVAEANQFVGSERSLKRPSNIFAQAKGTKPLLKGERGQGVLQPARLPLQKRATGQNFWVQTNGPQGGDGIALATNASGHICVGTQGGGIPRSTDYAETWTRVVSCIHTLNQRAPSANHAEE